MKKKQKLSKKSRPTKKPRVQNERLKGWSEIARFLGQPVAVAQRWARSGMPVAREGRFMYATREEADISAAKLVWAYLFTSRQKTWISLPI
jgi:hypothetical protein